MEFFFADRRKANDSLTLLLQLEDFGGCPRINIAAHDNPYYLLLFPPLIILITQPCHQRLYRLQPASAHDSEHQFEFWSKQFVLWLGGPKQQASQTRCCQLQTYLCDSARLDYQFVRSLIQQSQLLSCRPRILQAPMKFWGATIHIYYFTRPPSLQT